MKINYSYSEISQKIKYSPYTIFVSKLDNDYSYDISVGDVLFIRVIDSKIVKLDYNFDDYSEDSVKTAEYVIKTWIIF